MLKQSGIRVYRFSEEIYMSAAGAMVAAGASQPRKNKDTEIL